MIYGIGTDVCDVRRIAASLDRHGERFARRILSDAEFATWRQRTARWPERGVRYLATRFSAKEAFSKAVFARQTDLSGSIVLDPPLPGQTSLADDHTLVFRPDAPLAPSTEYRARLSTSKLGTHAFQLQGSAATSFNTERFAVKNLRLYYNYDLLHQNETELVGEVDFNQPVAEERFRKQGSSAEEAMVLAGERRLRPILMTALATVAGMLPLSMALGAGSQMLQPLAIAVIGGILASIALSLIVTPVVHYRLAKRPQ